MKKIIFITIILLVGNIYGQQCNLPDPFGPGGDSADDNYSYSNTCNETFCAFTQEPEIIVYKRGFFNESLNLYDHLSFALNVFSLNGNQGSINSYCNVLVLPSGALFGQENNTTLKIVLDNYVKSGGTVIVFAQQFGNHVDNVVPIPDGESLKTYGWREDWMG